MTRLSWAAALALFLVSSTPTIAQNSHQESYDADSGPALRWEGAFGDVASLTGNRNFGIELFSWTAFGGMEMDFTVFHNNRSTHNSELGHKWTHAYDIYLGLKIESGPQPPGGALRTSLLNVPTPLPPLESVIVHWGTDGACEFTKLLQTQYSVLFTSPPGIYDTLVGYTDANGYSHFELTTKEGTVYKFTNPTGFQWGCSLITDRVGRITSIARSPQLNVRDITDPTGRAIHIEFDDPTGRITSVRDPMDRVWTFQYSAAGDLYRINWPLVNGQAYYMEFAYDASHNLTGYRDRRGNWWTHGYLNGAIAWSKDPLLNTWSFSGSSMTDPNGRTFSHSYAMNGTLSSESDSLSYSTSYVRDAGHNPTQITDRRSKVWVYTYDSKGNITSERTPLNHLWQWTWTSNSDLLSATTPLNHRTDYTYLPNTPYFDTITDPLNHVDSFSWHASGGISAATNALNFTTQIGYDQHGNAISVTDPNNNTVQASHNLLGEVLTQKDGLLNETVYTRDEWGRVTAVSVAGTMVFQAGYDANDNMVWHKDGLNNQSSSVFDAANRVVSVTNGRNDQVVYAWDAFGKKALLSSKTNGNNETTVYSYTARNEKASNSYPDGTSESWTYDPEGNIASHTDGKGATVLYVHDDSGRMTKIDFPIGWDTLFYYDASDRRIEMVDSVAYTYWTWDAADRLTQLQTNNGTLVYGYDNADRRTSITKGTSVWTYTLDPGGRTTSILNPFSETTGWIYNAANLPIQQTFSSGAITTFQYDAQLRTTDVWHKTSGGATLGRYQTGHNAVNVTSRTDNDGSVTSFGYDGANQLSSEVRTGPGAYSIGYLYDNNGNRTQKTLNGVPEVYTYGSNDRILTAGGRSYVTDNNGNVTSVTVGGLTTALSYDFENQLTRMDFPGGAFNVFKYNGLGLRVFTQDSRGNTAYVTDGMEAASPVMLDSAATYTPGVSERRGGVSKFYHPDHLGSTRGITNSSQAATDAMLHDAFGTLVSRTGTTPTPFGYVGQEQYQSDVDSGLMLLGHRYYDPYTGRFITQDPIGDDRNWYGYVGNDPQNWVDPEGLQRNSNPGGRTPPIRNPARTGLNYRKPPPRLNLFFAPDYNNQGKPFANRNRSGGRRISRPVPPGAPSRLTAEQVIDLHKLPRTGPKPYIPPPWWSRSEPLPRGPGGKGFRDRDGNVWIPGPNHHFPEMWDPIIPGQRLSFEWDVQLPRGGHINVSPYGDIR